MTSAELVLLVNDIPDHALNYQAALAQNGFRVQLAQSGQEALRIAGALLPHCAVIDLRLPDMSGWELCSRIKSHRDAHRTRIIVLTPDVSKMCAVDSAKVGCNAWLAQPTVAEDLVRTVRQVLDLESDEPGSLDEALLGLTVCPACDSDKVRATLRVGSVQNYCCRTCRFCWRVEATKP